MTRGMEYFDRMLLKINACGNIRELPKVVTEPSSNQLRRKAEVEIIDLNNGRATQLFAQPLIQPTLTLSFQFHDSFESHRDSRSPSLFPFMVVQFQRKNAQEVR